MKISVNKDEFLSALVNVSKAAAVKSTMPIIEGMLLKASSSEVYLCCYNLELGIAKSVRASVGEPGNIVVPTKICEIVRKMPGDVIEISSDDKLILEIKSGNTTFNIVGQRVDEFPELPRVSGSDKISLSQGLLRSMISQTSYAIATTDINPVYKGALFEYKDRVFQIVTLDGYRLAVRSEEVNQDSTERFIVPGKTVSEIKSLLSDDDSEAEIIAADSNIIFVINGYSVISRLFTGEFLNYKDTFSREYKYEVKVKTSDIISIVDRVSLVNTDSYKSPVKCKISSSGIKMSCETPIGKVSDEISCKGDFSEIIEIGFNSKYMQDCFKNADCDELLLRIMSSDKPVQVIPPNGEHFLFLLLPVRLSN